MQLCHVYSTFYIMKLNKALSKLTFDNNLFQHDLNSYLESSDFQPLAYEQKHIPSKETRTHTEVSFVDIPSFNLQDALHCLITYFGPTITTLSRQHIY